MQVLLITVIICVCAVKMYVLDQRSPTPGLRPGAGPCPEPNQAVETDFLSPLNALTHAQLICACCEHPCERHAIICACA